MPPQEVTPTTHDERFVRVVKDHAVQAAQQTSLNEYGQFESPTSFHPYHSEEHHHRSQHREW